jgi:hypothetical protein
MKVKFSLVVALIIVTLLICAIAWADGTAREGGMIQIGGMPWAG